MSPSPIPASPALAAEAHAGPARAGVAAWYGLFVLVLVSLVGALDKQIFPLVAEPIRLSLGLSDTQLGLLQGIGGILITSIAAFPLGWLSDRFDRRYVLAFSALVWSAASAWRGVAAGFPGLFVATLALSGGEAGLVPATYGIIPSLFPKAQRVFANGVYVVALYLAAYGGLALCGALLTGLEAARPHLPAALQHVETWRAAFVILALPGPVVALLLLTLRKSNGTSEAAAAQAQEPGAGQGLLAYMRANWVAVAGVCVGSGVIAIGSAVRLWSPVIAERVFHATPGQAGGGLGAAGVVGWMVGFALTAGIALSAARAVGGGAGLGRGVGRHAAGARRDPVLRAGGRAGGHRNGGLHRLADPAAEPGPVAPAFAADQPVRGDRHGDQCPDADPGGPDLGRPGAGPSRALDGGGDRGRGRHGAGQPDLLPDRDPL
jgi:MFS family permease